MAKSVLDAGWSTTDVVTLSQLVSFLAFQIRVVAGLAAQGITEIHDVHHIDRGYDDLVGRLSSLGADVVRLDS